MGPLSVPLQTKTADKKNVKLNTHEAGNFSAGIGATLCPVVVAARQMISIRADWEHLEHLLFHSCLRWAVKIPDIPPPNEP